ncbi:MULTISPECIES: hypothetical protein [Lacrimispora]|uniref:hypothetical protein n=1 Tax=Lacrimispora TaxID=2719231 RepID=UPI000BE2B5AF|nr:hypothetical protein [Lacrimispora amygdalina]MDK2968280.1 hypothetical protein [Lacrimispora sp.]
MLKKQELIVCLDMDMLRKVLNILDSYKIKYESKVFNHNNQWGSTGSRRGMFGNLFVGSADQYIVYVSKDDYELAKSKIAGKL